MPLIESPSGGGGGASYPGGEYDISVGSVNDGVTDDKAAIQARIDAAPDYSLLIWPSTFKPAIASSISLINRVGVVISSVTGRNSNENLMPQAKWKGGVGGTMIAITRSRYCSILGLCLDANPDNSNKANVGIAIDGYSSGQISSHNEVGYCLIISRFSVPSNANFIGVAISQTELVNNNEFMSVHDCCIVASGESVSKYDGGSISSGSPTLTVSDGNFTSATTGQVVRVGGAGTAGATLVTTGTYVNTTTLTLANNAATTVSSGGRVHVGKCVGKGIAVGANPNSKNHYFQHNAISRAGTAIEVLNGSFHINNISAGNNEIDVSIASIVEPSPIENINTETSRQGVVITNSNPTAVLITGNRAANEMQLTEGFYDFRLANGSKLVNLENNIFAVLPPTGGQVVNFGGNALGAIFSRGNFWAPTGGMTEAQAGFGTIGNGSDGLSEYENYLTDRVTVVRYYNYYALLQARGQTAAVLNANAVSNGSIAYASDGTPGSSPLTGSGTGCLVVRMNGSWVGLGAGSTFTGGTITTPILGPAITSTNPAYSFTAQTNSGLGLSTDNPVIMSLGTAVVAGFNGTKDGIAVRNDGQILWSSNVTAAQPSSDIGLARNAAGVGEANNGTIGTYRDWQFRNVLLSGTVTNYNGVATTGNGLPSIVGSTRVTAQSAANSSIATYTVGAADSSFEVSMNMNVTAATALSTSMNCNYTDESSTARTMILPTTSLSGAFLAGGLVTATGAFETPVMHIRCKASTAITLYTATGTFTSVTYTAEGNIKQTR